MNNRIICTQKQLLFLRDCVQAEKIIRIPSPSTTGTFLAG